MAKKLVALFVMCIVVVAAMHAREAEATNSEALYKACFLNCQDACKVEGNGFTHCEVKCDTECSNKEEEEKLNIKLH
ncbi:major pollen allergen Ole e 6 [Morus notabilis]|uniref:major pollen allergen Ole e 6 n=1 Tax=Morus notabilis TaxID=981085 RepID=UPI000CED264E|nr:major pollen allergen Ole e 6 [Morus notabilis]